MDALSTALAKILVEVLRYFQGREDLKALVREEIRAAGLVSANAALGWKADALGQPDGGATLEVKDGASVITIPGPVTITPEKKEEPPA